MAVASGTEHQNEQSTHFCFNDNSANKCQAKVDFEAVSEAFKWLQNMLRQLLPIVSINR